jgi:hypothetical protein
MPPFKEVGYAQTIRKIGQFQNEKVLKVLVKINWKDATLAMHM